ncbi:hypothetical protein [Salinarimonas sp.]|uniref:hypothetical protein n=1 Tax=Salinarimonas sp. TaxID=2766526 RepID=UPI0032D91E4B
MTFSGKASLLKQERAFIEAQKKELEKKLQGIDLKSDVYVDLALGNMVDIRPSFPSSRDRSPVKAAS